MARSSATSEPESLEPEFEPGEADGGVFGDGPPARRAQNFWPSARRLFGLLRPERGRMVLVIGLVSASVVLTVIAPKILGQAMDTIFNGVIGSQLPAGVPLEQIIQQQHASGNDTFADMLARAEIVPGRGIDFVVLGRLIILVLLMYVIASVLMWAQGYLLNALVMRVVYGLRQDIEAKINRLPLRYFDTRQRGDVMSRVTNDVDNIQSALQQAFSQLIQSLLTIIGIAVIMFIVSWQLAVIAMIALPLSGVIAGIIGTRSQKLFAAQWKNTGALNGHIEETFSGLEIVRAFGRDREMLEEFDRRNDRLFSASFGAQFVSGMIMPAMTFVSYLSYVLIAVVGGLRVASGQLTLGDATAFIQYSREFTQPVSELAGMANMLQSGIASAERTFEFLDADEQRPDTALDSLPSRTDGRVEFQDVSFSYDPEQPLIEALTFSAEPGHTVAIVGPTGAGKTTLVNLVMRFYELTGGRILLDGIDITRLARGDLRTQVGMVLQDAWLFQGTIRENIRYGRLEATDAEVVDAARATMVDRFVRQLPEGYDTVLDAEGGSVSAGERQLITIARAFLANPSLLIFDEATSSVDTRTELLVQQAMNALRTDRTSFVIAHRLSTIRSADTILVMEGGRIVEQGTHTALMARRGAYYELFMTQFRGGGDEEGTRAQRPGS
ncbi:ABC transporter ATP-binding protein [Rathayibacter toxicus]|uniref:ABC transporter ATP-binding protein n=1 Tax=Rathayibacter toxicus TaxID=145458 RepID=UPI000CE8FF36|nr:ABC transporter ATP-binding protein [Rathayibacter toxicus]PPI56718.1 multidrug ABC transporter ATP-binding protein [Rathayibacter toxicus]QOD10523.1 ABC transporter ATP-binding protein [Rathayibacter toxicus]QWL27259.1 ABC transporter ATP-binding protein [Rathayibacter toxicus]QWL31476.1 ABC transporter ATP-binding protein [Rathayibacter toxicus]QWL33567.1 ABC transporter ATP-binding protein [Rathayibacter toxicus]